MNRGRIFESNLSERSLRRMFQLLDAVPLESGKVLCIDPDTGVVGVMEASGSGGGGGGDMFKAIYDTDNDGIVDAAETAGVAETAETAETVPAAGISGTISTAQIADDAVTADKIAYNAILSAAINANAVTTVKIGNSQVTNTKLANMAAGTVKANTGGAAAAEDMDEFFTLVETDHADIVREINVYELLDNPDAPEGPEQYFGVRTNLATPKPLWDVLTTHAAKGWSFD